MIVATDPNSCSGRPSLARRSMARSIASATATAWGTVNDTVALMDTPR